MHYINGEWIEGKGKIFQSSNPADMRLIWEGREATAQEIELAYKAAHSRLDTWARLTLEERIHYLKAFQEELKHKKAHLAEIISQETGKPLWDSLGEVTAMIGKVDISIEAFHQRCPQKREASPMGANITRHKPHGVVAVFGPYNFPGHLPNGHIIPALLAGNTVIFKPSELTPLTAEMTLQVWEKAGLPKGVLNLLQGGKDTGILTSQHPQLNGLFFTGSWPTGKALLQTFMTQPNKILALEMGGNNPLVFDEVEAIDAAVLVTLQSSFMSAGQRCTCARRLIVIESPSSAKFITHLTEATQKIKVGSYQERPEPYMGPVISEQAALAILKRQEALRAKGAISLVPVRHLQDKTGFLSPGLIDVTEVSDLEDEEIFGPLLQIIRVNNFDSALKVANQTEYGLSSGILTDHPSHYRLFYENIRAGIVNWNTPLTGASSRAPFGGIGKSGNFRPSAYYAADYCAYPVASTENDKLALPKDLPPGVSL